MPAETRGPHEITDNDGLALSVLHKRLRESERDGEADAGELERIQDRIRQALPRAGTDRVLPQKKAPSGKTQVLHMNYTRGQADKPVETEVAHLRFFARTAKKLGLRLEILTDQSSRDDLATELENGEYETLTYHITESQQPVSKWAEDSVEYLENGKMAVLTPFNETLLAWAMTAGRRQRWHIKVSPDTLEEALQDDHLWIPLAIRVNGSGTGIEREHVAQAQGQEVSRIRAYIEGGNLIPGEDATGRPVLLIGKDAIATTAHIYQLDAGDVRKIICEDFGLETLDQVICVEQPGQFHLDMGLLFIGRGVVIVNDSSKNLKDAVEMAELVPCLTTEKMAAKLTFQCALETAAAEDLENAGMKVFREKLENGTNYNFFNGEFVEGKDGLLYYITNGGPQPEEERFEALMVQEWKVVKHVIFSPRDIAPQSLAELGGVGCRLKGAPNI